MSEAVEQSQIENDSDARNQSSEVAISEQELEDVVETVERLPNEQRRVVMERLEVYQGELPHPKILEGYNQLYPEAAKRIIENGIAETVHRRAFENFFAEKQFSERRRGQYFGFIVALASIGGGVYLMSSGHTVIGSILSGTVALGLVAQFTGTNKNS